MEIIGVILGIILGVSLVLIISFCIVKTAYISFVNKHSVLISTINDMNKKYTFYPFVSYDQIHTYDNENFFNEISEEDYLIYQLQSLSFKINEQIRLMNFNKTWFNKYIKDLESIKISGEYNKSTKGYIVKILNHYEQMLYRKQIKKSPKTEYFITITLCLSKINGQIYRKKTSTFNSNEILKLMARLKNINGTFYKDRGIWDAICRVERGKVSNKIRFKVYQRDGYRCKYCHSTQNLEVDHIKPIAKGGKTTIDNLQTLCHNCNVKKGNGII